MILTVCYNSIVVSDLCCIAAKMKVTVAVSRSDSILSRVKHVGAVVVVWWSIASDALSALDQNFTQKQTIDLGKLFQLRQITSLGCCEDQWFYLIAQWIYPVFVLLVCRCTSLYFASEHFTDSRTLDISYKYFKTLLKTYVWLGHAALCLRNTLTYLLTAHYIVSICGLFLNTLAWYCSRAHCWPF